MKKVICILLIGITLVFPISCANNSAYAEFEDIYKPIESYKFYEDDNLRIFKNFTENTGLYRLDKNSGNVECIEEGHLGNILYKNEYVYFYDVEETDIVIKKYSVKDKTVIEHRITDKRSNDEIKNDKIISFVFDKEDNQNVTVWVGNDGYYLSMKHKILEKDELVWAVYKLNNEFEITKLVYSGGYDSEIDLGITSENIYAIKDGQFISINMNTCEETHICDADNAFRLSLCNNGIVLISEYGEKSILYNMKNNTKKEIDLIFTKAVSKDNNTYCVGVDGIYKISEKDFSYKKIYSHPVNPIGSLMAIENQLYFAEIELGTGRYEIKSIPIK